MKKVLLILKREYEMRVVSRPFLVLCLVLPLLLTAMVMSTVINIKSPEKKEHKKRSELVFQVIGQGGLFAMDSLPAIGNIDFDLQKEKSLEYCLEELANTDYTGIIHFQTDSLRPIVEVYSYSELPRNIERAIRLNIENYFSEPDSQSKAQQAQLTYQKLEYKQEERQPIEMKTVLGIALGCIVYFFIFFYGVRTLNAVVEEKMNRISEIIISSARPMELMFGKIFGITLAVLTQVLIVAVATLLLSKLAIGVLAPEPVVSEQAVAHSQANAQLFSAFELLSIILLYAVYFILGFMLYAAIFAAIGAAMEPSEDTLQFVFPVLIPLVFSVILVITSAMSNPENNVMFWASLFPLTSPVVMSFRIATGVVWWEVVLSLVLLIGCFVCVTFLAGRIYRVGILLYGTKPNIKMIGRWLLSRE